MIIDYPKRDDEENARHWRGPLFPNFDSPVMWRDGYYKTIKQPHSVTFPICALCNHIMWDWPHFEEQVPDDMICDACFNEEKQAQERDG